MFVDLQHFGNLLCSVYFHTIFLMIFLKLKYSKRKTLCLLVPAALLIITLEMVRMIWLPQAVWAKLTTALVQLIIIQGAGFLAAKKVNPYTLFVSFSAAVFGLNGSVAILIFGYFSDNALLGWLLGFSVDTLVLVLLFYFGKGIGRNMLDKEMSWWMSVLPACLYETFYLLLYFPVSVHEKPENLFAAVLLLVTIVVLYTLMLRYLDTRLMQEYVMRENYTLGKYAKGLGLHFDEMNEVQTKVRIMKHDLRHTFNLLLELQQQGHYEEVTEILSRDIQKLDIEEPRIYCENITINSVLISMAAIAKSMGVRLEIQAELPAKLSLEDKELAVVLSNLLENALTAVKELEEKERSVQLKLRLLKGERLFLEVKNPCYEEVEFSEETGLPVSKKGKGHGFGMVSIHDFAVTYHAELDCYLENNIFVTRILVHSKEAK